ncbi:DNA-binding transcriptional MocR family regulator [Friedmanniella endophytica]|uniref:DNA-binding transcriptional MocR family regulator n=1 Tax=Microlunatus kandeliicorticis TaxID=1759536 RepID=A0A7W3P486_9ACTN|nr:aminotransferase class I/II-fold pyridoxal phosphate-dependent enzyme [Microlunatus kandeliicorticis]MBA8792612.1 DNA-binding transcriptional MocR family regulator [Microlunatus kandeliicorticis]
MDAVRYRPRGGTVKELVADLEQAIAAGTLPPEAPLPPIRALADDLGVAPGTVAGAYATLRDRGLLETRGRAGTFVRYRPAGATRVLDDAPPGAVDLAGGQPDPQLLPDLSALAGDVFGAGLVAAAPTGGVLPEVAAEARRRLDGDGVPAGPVALTHGGLDGLGRVLRTRLRPGDAVAVEDPGWPNALALAAGLGLRTVPVAVDDAGPRPDALDRALAGGATAVVVTDRAQNPTGARLDADRAAELRAVLTRHPDTLLVEDDHAAELAGTPLHALAGATRWWAFVRSASKPYGPDLRAAVVTGDEETMTRVEDGLRVGPGWVSTVLQRLLLGCWQSADVAAQVGRAAAAYDLRRSTLVQALTGAGLDAVGGTGLNVWVRVPDEAAVTARLLTAGWAVAPGTRFRLRAAPGIRITVSHLDPGAVPRLAADLADALTPGRGFTA